MPNDVHLPRRDSFLLPLGIYRPFGIVFRLLDDDFLSLVRVFLLLDDTFSSLGDAFPSQVPVFRLQDHDFRLLVCVFRQTEDTFLPLDDAFLPQVHVFRLSDCAFLLLESAFRLLGHVFVSQEYAFRPSGCAFRPLRQDSPPPRHAPRTSRGLAGRVLGLPHGSRRRPRRFRPAVR